MIQGNPDVALQFSTHNVAYTMLLYAVRFHTVPILLSSVHSIFVDLNVK